MSALTVCIIIAAFLMVFAASRRSPERREAIGAPELDATGAQCETILSVLEARSWARASSMALWDAPAHGGIGRALGVRGAMRFYKTEAEVDLFVSLVPTRRDEAQLRLTFSAEGSCLPDGLMSGPEGVHWLHERPGESIVWSWPQGVDGAEQLRRWLALLGLKAPAAVWSAWERAAQYGEVTWRFGEIEGEWSLEWVGEVELNGALTGRVVAFAALAEISDALGRARQPEPWEVLRAVWEGLPADDERAWRAVGTQYQRTRHSAAIGALVARAAQAWRDEDHAALSATALTLWRLDSGWGRLRALPAADRARMTGEPASGWANMLVAWGGALLDVLPPADREREARALFDALAAEVDWKHAPVQTLTSAGWRAALGLSMSEAGLQRLSERQLGEVWAFLCDPPEDEAPEQLKARILECSMTLLHTPVEAGYGPLLALPVRAPALVSAHADVWSPLLNMLRRRESVFVYGDWRDDAEACALALFLAGGRHTWLREEALLVLRTVGGLVAVRGLGGFLAEPDAEAPARLVRRAQEVADALVASLGDALPRGDGGLTLAADGPAQDGELTLTETAAGALTMREEGT